MDSFPVEVLMPDGNSTKGEFVLEYLDVTDSNRVRLTLHFDNREVQSKPASDAFAALQDIRSNLEVEHIRINCYGSSRNIYPSGMGRDMGYGLKAYRLSLGTHSELTGLVSIFDSEPDLDLVAVEEQDAFYQVWLNSLKNKLR